MMSLAPSLVSVIIPTYNYGSYIAKAVDSVFAQTYGHLEVIVVDDGSTDNTKDVLQKYDDKLVYIQQNNQGAAAARNRGLKEASGDYICFLDADDTYCPSNIAEKVRFLEVDESLDWCYSNWVWVDEADNEMMRGDEPEVSLAHIKAEGDVLNLALQGYRLGTNVFMLRKSLIAKLNGFDTDLKVLEDYDYYLRAAALGKLGFVDKVLCHVYEHEGSLGGGCDKAVAYKNRWRMHQKMKRMFGVRLMSPSVRQAWKLQQADLYRNLSVVMFAKGYSYRASVLLQASLKNQCWQPGGWLLSIKIWKSLWFG